ncbi:MAG: hypothetical protein MJ160_05685 [Treponema sp.]|nr:hypothetical protein [Treponema sp.]
MQIINYSNPYQRKIYRRPNVFERFFKKCQKKYHVKEILLTVLGILYLYVFVVLCFACGQY